MKRDEQRYLYSFKKNRIKKFWTQNLKRGTVKLVLVQNIEILNKEKGKM